MKKIKIVSVMQDNNNNNKHRRHHQQHHCCLFSFILSITPVRDEYPKENFCRHLQHMA